MELREEILTGWVLPLPGALPGGQALAVYPQLPVCARCFSFHKTVSFATFVMPVAIRQEFAFCFCKKRVRFISLGFTSEKNLGGGFLLLNYFDHFPLLQKTQI